MANPKVIVEFLAEMTGLDRGIRNVQNTARQSESSWRRLGGVIAGAVSVGAVVAFGRASVSAAMEDAEAQTTLATALRNVTGATDAQVASAESYLSNLSRQAAIADDELRPALGNLVRATGDVATAQDALSLATDIAAARGQSVEAVSQALAKAYQGQTGGLRRLGIATEDAAGNALSLDQIMQGAANTFEGQAAAAAGTAAGEMRNASIQFGEFQEEVGAALLPVLSDLAGFLTDKVVPALQDVLAFVKDNIDWLGPLALAIGGVTAAVYAINTAVGIWNSIQMAAKVATQGWAVAMRLLNSSFLANPIVLVVAAVAALIAAFVLAYQKVDWFRAAVDTAVDGIVAAFNWLLEIVKGIWNWISNNWKNLLTILTGPIGIAVRLITENWNTIKTAASDLYNWVRGKFQAMVDFIRGLVTTVRDIATRIGDAILAPINLVIRGWNAFRFPTVTFDVPHIPGTDIGGDVHFGGWRLPHIPELARGGLLTAPTLFVGGEGGAEIVSPVSMLRALIAEGSSGGNIYVTVNAPPTADLASIGKATIEAILAAERVGGRAWRSAQTNVGGGVALPL